MKIRRTLNLSVFVSLCLSLTLPFNSNHAVATQQQQRSPNQSNETQLKRDARILRDFTPAREMLQRKGVPFDPDTMLDPDWKEKLARQFDEMPELQTVREPGRRLKGVHMAGILYLPEKVQVDGDLVILARQVIFEGKDAVIKGNHNVYFFPIDVTGFLGTTLEVAMNKQEPRFQKASFGGSPPKAHVPPLLADGWSITIDTSGRGREEWLAEQNHLLGVKFVKTSWQGGTVNHDGSAGSTGSTGGAGLTGGGGGPDPAAAGAAGNCSTSHPSGTNGSTGANGSSGGFASNGGTGTAGGNASAIIATITTVNGTYNYYARGGNGG